MEKEKPIISDAWEHLQDEVIQERIQQLLGAYASENVYIRTLRKRLKTLEKDIFSAQELPQSIQSILEDYLADIYQETSLTQKYLYTQGMLDCIQLLRNMKLIY